MDRSDLNPRPLVVPAATTLLLLFLTACGASTGATSSSMTNSAAAFKTWHQGFNHDTEGWIGKDEKADDDPDGWCGTMQQHARGEGPVAPSAGNGYAVATGGECVEFWHEVLGPDYRSGPGSPGAGYSDAWPASGYVMELDVHLDPAELGAGFGYMVSISLLDARPAEPENILDHELWYFTVPVEVDDSGVSVAGRDITDPGWHTFRHVFSEDTDASLAVDFALMRRGRTLHTVPLEQATNFTENRDTASFEAGNVGNGYIWLDLAHGLALPIDEHRVRQGG